MSEQKTLAEKAKDIIEQGHQGQHPHNTDTPNPGVNAHHADRHEQPVPGGDLVQGGQHVSLARATGARAAGSKGR